jgi:hypothetical protein
MELNIVNAVIIWVGTIIANLCFIRILDENRLSFSEIVNKELWVLIIICVFAPASFIILLFGVLAKIGVAIANALPLAEDRVVRKGCRSCSHRCNNECLFFKLTLRPKMLCKGKFFNNI